jgi:gluconolactonase
MDDGAVLVVEIKRGTLTRVDRDGSVDVVADCGGGPNGAAIGPDGKVWICNNGGFEWHERNGFTLPGDQPADYRGGSIQRVDLGTGEVETVYESVGGHRLRGPNDLVFDHTGGFWFTDHGKNRERERDRGGLYYASADGDRIEEVVFPLLAPNGVGLSPSGDRLYVAETYEGRLYVWDLAGPGRIRDYHGPEHRGTVLADPEGGPLFDSLAVDADGNVCVATIRNGGITVVAPDGAHHHVSFDDPLTTNICFGGPERRTAFVTLSATGRLVACEWSTAGLELAFNA